MPEDRSRRTPHTQQSSKSSTSGWQLIAVQSISCVVIILIVLAFRLIGGPAFSQLRQSFNRSIMSNSILATIAVMLDKPPDKPASDSNAESTDNSEDAGNDATNNPADESTKSGDTTANATEATSSTTTDTSATTAATTVNAAAAGGKDIAASAKPVCYAPTGATFIPLKINRLASKPLESGTVTSCFGYRENPTKGGRGFHQGVDIAANTDSPISAMYFGVVTEVGENSSYGKYVRLYHGNGLHILYAHCSQILVQKDAVIKAGEIIAKVGSTGDSTGPHVHIETLLNGVAYDPAGIVPLDTYA